MRKAAVAVGKEACSVLSWSATSCTNAEHCRRAQGQHPSCLQNAISILKMQSRPDLEDYLAKAVNTCLRYILHFDNVINAAKACQKERFKPHLGQMRSLQLYHAWSKSIPQVHCQKTAELGLLSGWAAEASEWAAVPTDWEAAQLH